MQVTNIYVNFGFITLSYNIMVDTLDVLTIIYCVQCYNMYTLQIHIDIKDIQRYMHISKILQVC